MEGRWGQTRTGHIQNIRRGQKGCRELRNSDPPQFCPADFGSVPQIGREGALRLQTSRPWRLCRAAVLAKHHKKNVGLRVSLLRWGGGGSLRLGAPQCLRKARTTSHYTAPLQSCLLPMEAPVIEKRQCAPEPGHCTRWPLSCCSRPRSGDEDQWKERIALGVLDLARNQASTDSVFLVWWPENETWNPSFLGSVSLPCHILGSLTSVT